MSLALALSLLTVQADHVATRCVNPVCVQIFKLAPLILYRIDNSAEIPYAVVMRQLNPQFQALPFEDPGVVVAAKGRLWVAGARIRCENCRPPMQLKLDVLPGDPTQEIPEPVLHLPFAPGHAFSIDQGYYGEYSHFGDSSYGLDFRMDEGTPVHAAAGGLVFDVRDRSDTGGPHSELRNHGNFIRVFHADGSIGEYHHLAKNGSLVEEGDRVKTGDPIGISGATGFASGPHLHFSVHKPAWSGRAPSIPSRFWVFGQAEPIRLDPHTAYMSALTAEPESIRMEPIALDVASIKRGDGLWVQTASDAEWAVEGDLVVGKGNHEIGLLRPASLDRFTEGWLGLSFQEAEEAGLAWGVVDPGHWTALIYRQGMWHLIRARQHRQTVLSSFPALPVRSTLTVLLEATQVFVGQESVELKHETPGTLAAIVLPGGRVRLEDLRYAPPSAGGNSG